MASKDYFKFWIRFCETAGLPSQVSFKYAMAFHQNRIKENMLLDLNKEYLMEMGITRMGDIIAILKHAKEVSEEDGQSTILESKPSPKRIIVNKSVAFKAVPKVPEYYRPELPPSPPPPTVNSVIRKVVQPKVTEPVKRVIAKSAVVKDAKPLMEIALDEFQIELPAKRARRVLPEQQQEVRKPKSLMKLVSQAKVGKPKPTYEMVSKKTVFDRLGEASVSSTTGANLQSKAKMEKMTRTISGSTVRSSISRPSTTKTSLDKSVFSRLGNRSAHSQVTAPRSKYSHDAEKWEEKKRDQWERVSKRKPPREVSRMKRKDVSVKPLLPARMKKRQDGVRNRHGSHSSTSSSSAKVDSPVVSGSGSPQMRLFANT